MDEYIPPDQITQTTLGVTTLYVIALREADPSNLQRYDLFIARIMDLPDFLSVWLTADSAEMYVAKYIRGKEPPWYRGFRDTDPKVLALSIEQVKDYISLMAPFELGLLIMDIFLQ